METKPHDCGPQSLPILSPHPFCPQAPDGCPGQGETDLGPAPWELRPAGEVMGTHVALGTIMEVAQALSHLPVGLMLPDETGLPHLQEGAHSRAETRMLQASGAPLSTPGVHEP